MQNDGYSKLYQHYFIKGSDPNAALYNKTQSILGNPLTMVSTFANNAITVPGLADIVAMISPGAADIAGSIGTPSDILILTVGGSIKKYSRNLDTFTELINSTYISYGYQKMHSFAGEIYIKNQL